MPRRSPADRFWAHVRRDASGCWLWTGAIAGDTGYGIFNRGGGALIGAHCFAWELANPGQARAGKVVRHACDTRACVNPRHLQIGTHADNTADMDARGRRGSNPPRGEHHPRARLTVTAVAAARRAHRAGTSIGDLAEMFGVAVSTMSAAVRGRTWHE